MLNRLVTPIQGVYAVQVETKSGKFNGVANVGNRPTINGRKPLLEVNFFIFSPLADNLPITKHFSNATI